MRWRTEISINTHSVCILCRACVNNEIVPLENVGFRGTINDYFHPERYTRTHIEYFLWSVAVIQQKLNGKYSTSFRWFVFAPTLLQRHKEHITISDLFNPCTFCQVSWFSWNVVCTDKILRFPLKISFIILSVLVFSSTSSRNLIPLFNNLLFSLPCLLALFDMFPFVPNIPPLLLLLSPLFFCSRNVFLSHSKVFLFYLLVHWASLIAVLRYRNLRICSFTSLLILILPLNT